MVKNYTPIDDLIKQNKNQVSKPKEAEPFSGKSEKIVLKEVVEHEPKNEVKPYLKVRKETIEIPPDLKKMGVSTLSTPKFANYKNVVLPISDDKVLKGLHAPIYSSLRWLATLAWYLLQQAHLTLKVVHGHVVRVIKR